MVSKENLEKLIKVAGKMKVIIITGDSRDMWDIKAEINNFAYSQKTESEMTGSGVMIKGFKPIIVTVSGEVERGDIRLEGAVFVTSENPLKIAHTNSCNSSPFVFKMRFLKVALCFYYIIIFKCMQMFLWCCIKSFSCYFYHICGSMILHWTRASIVLHIS